MIDQTVISVRMWVKRCGVLLAVALFALSTLVVGGCEQESEVEEAAEETGEMMEDAAEEAGDAAEDAGDEMQDAMN